MLTKSIHLFIECVITNLLSQNTSHDLAIVSTEIMLELSKKIFIGLGLMTIFGISLLTFAAEILLQKYFSTQIIFSSVLIASLFMILVAMTSTYILFNSKLSLDTKRLNQDSIDRKSISNLMDSISKLILVYSDERKKEMNNSLII